MPKRTYPFKKKRRTHKRARQYPPVGVRRHGPLRATGDTQKAVYTFRRGYRLTLNVQDVPAIDNQTLKFALSSLPSYTEFTALYDMYRIAKVKVEFFFDKTLAAMPTATAEKQAGQMFYGVVDTDDANALATETDYLQYQNVKKAMIGAGKNGRIATFYFTPCVAQAAYNGAWTGYSNRVAPWCDCDSAGIEHYGLKYAISQSVGGTNSVICGRIWILVTYTVQFKGVK